MNKIDVSSCYSPALLHLYDYTESLVVFIDIFRATSTIAAAMGNGAKEIIPVDNVAECIQLGTEIENSITAGERNGQVVEGLQYGNSPSAYPGDFIKGKTLVLTTTNGTRLLHQIKNAPTILSGSFLNLQATANYIKNQDRQVLLACASWKDRFNLEDTLFAGALYEAMGESVTTSCDSTLGALALYQAAKHDLFGFLKQGSHFHRLSKFGLEEDMRYCCMLNAHDNVIQYNGKALIIPE